jgi:Skp family chaperone for outer membrane proteins
MIYNAQEVIGSALTWNVAQQILRDEVEKMEKEIQAIRTNMVLVDREIRVAEMESDGLEEGKEEADAMELAAREAKGYAHAVRQERQRMEDEVRRMGELEAKLKAVGKM